MTTREAYKRIRASNRQHSDGWAIPAYKALFYARCRSGAIRVMLPLKANKYA
jgi:hypothetical protein